MIVTLYNFAKKNNSTAVPESGTNFQNVILKEPTDILNPRIRFTAAGLNAVTTAPIFYNYARIPKFSRYYFISNWEYIGGCWECSLSVDVLASWKAIIGASSAYVERAESAYDGKIIDTAYPATTDYDIVNSSLSSAWYNVAPSGGTYVLGVINYQSSGKVGAVAYYALTNVQMTSVLQYLFSGSIYQASGITEIGEGLFKGIFNPFQYIISCIYYPLPITSFGATQTDVKLGYWSTGVNGIICDQIMEQAFITGQFPNHPQAASRGDYLNFSPYAYYTLHIPPFGAISIDSSFRRYGNYIRCPVFIDHITGQAICRIGVSKTNSGVPDIWAGEVTGVFGVPIQLAQIQSDYMGSLTSLAGGAASGNISGFLSGLVQSAISTFAPSVNCTGTNGSFIMSIAPAGMISSFAKITDASDNIIGKPLMAPRVINTLSGYIKCRDVRISAPCMDREKEMIESMMNGGFYFE